jgi:hypothetical protein
MIRLLLALSFVASALVAPAGALAGEGSPGAGAPAAQRMEILNNDSYQRAYLVFRTPVAITKDGTFKTPLDPNPDFAKAPRPIADFQSALPPADWMKPEFSAANWERVRAPVEAGPGSVTRGYYSQTARHNATRNSQICLISRFMVENLANAEGLALSLEYVGGVVVYVNGQELTRAHLPAGELKPETLAEKYPDDLYCEPGGLFLQEIKTNPAGFERRYRKLADVAVPAKLLRKGTNVLALEVRRAPINDAAIESKRTPSKFGMNETPGIWAYAGLRSLSLTAPAGSAVAPNVGRPKGIQVWNCAPSDTVTTFDYSDGGDPLPVAVSAPRNGVFSGRLVVSSDQAIKGLKVAVSDLTAAGGGGKLPASAVRVRFAEAAVAGKSWVGVGRCDGLCDSIPAEIPVVTAAPPRESFPRNFGKYHAEGQVPIVRKNMSCGAIAPLWFTVRVPKDAKPGRYEATIALSADGLAPVNVPLRVSVSPWAMPDPADFRVHNFAYLSEDDIAKRYDVPVWSAKHLELMGKSMALMAEVNSRQAIANLAINFYGGDKGAVDCSNEQSIVRWIRQPDGTYTYDFSIFDKYLDAVAKYMGKPALLRINCWGEFRPGWGDAPADPATCWKTVAAGRFVTRLDPATGKLEPMEQPIPGTSESLAFWKPVLDEVRKKVEARGWYDVTAAGHNSYNCPAHPTVVGVFKKIWPDGVWSFTAHNGALGAEWPSTDKGVTMPVRYADCVWTKGALVARGYRALLGPRPGFWCYTFRTEMFDQAELMDLRDVPEEEIMCGHDGVSDFAADLFPIKDQRGRYTCPGSGRGTGGPTCSTLAMLAPGPDGAIGTERFEMLREGVEIAEAILFIEKALQDKKISGDLEQRANRCLDERSDVFPRRLIAGSLGMSGRFDRDQQLMAIAGEVAAAVK